MQMKNGCVYGGSRRKDQSNGLWKAKFSLFLLGIFILLAGCSNSDFKIFNGSKSNPILSIAGTTTTTITLKWSTPTLEAYPRDTYTYTVAMSGTSGSEDFSNPSTNCVNVNSTSCIVSNLTSGGQYFFKVQATDRDYTHYSILSNEVTATTILLLPPTNLSATAGNGQATLNWVGPPMAVSYNIYEAHTSGGPYTKVDTSTNTSYTISGLTNGLSYYFAVTSVNSNGQESGYSNQAGVTLIPGAPTNLTAIAGNRQVSLTWNASTGATGYNIYYSQTPGGPYSIKAGSSINAYYTVSGLTNGLTYYFVVTAINSVGESGYSNQAGVVLISNAPANLYANAGNAQVSLTWNASIGATSYNVYYSQTAGGPFSFLYSIGNTSYTVTGLSNGITYYFVVRAVNSAGESGNSNEVNATPQPPPNPPTNLSATAGNGQATLTWNASIGATSYNVYYSQTAGGPYTVNGGSTTNTNITVTGLNNGLSYYFVVTAVNSLGEESGYSNMSGVTLISGAPTNLTASAGNGQATLTWNASLGATSYNIYYGTTSGGPYPNKLSTTNTSYTVTGLSNGITYYFVVTSINAGGESGYSNSANVTPEPPPPAPSNLVATAGHAQVSLSWNASTGATGYNIYYGTTAGGPYTINGGSTTNTNATVSGLSNGTPYYFVVTAVNSLGEESGYSNQASANPQPVSYTYSISLGVSTQSVAVDSSNYIWIGAGGTIIKMNVSGQIQCNYAFCTSNCNAWGVAIDQYNNVWVTNGPSNNVAEVNSSCNLINKYFAGSSPFGIAIDPSGNIWITNLNGVNSSVTKLSSNGSYIGTYTTGYGPMGIAVDASNNVWVANSGNGSNNNVTELSSIGSLIGNYTLGNNTFGIAIDTFNNVWVSGANVFKLNSSGVKLGTYPAGITPMGIAIDQNGNIFVLDDGGTITELSPSGSIIGTYYVSNCIGSLAIDRNGNIWVPTGNSSIIELVGVAAGPQYFPYTGPQFPGGGNNY
jgi:fibronectin type 3 domain-containing protein/streptogramin lyase